MPWTFHVTYSGPDLAAPAPVTDCREIRATLADEEWMVCDMTGAGVVFARSSGEDIALTGRADEAAGAARFAPSCPFPIRPPVSASGTPFLAIRRTTPDGGRFSIAVEPSGDEVEIDDPSSPIYLFLPEKVRSALEGFDLHLGHEDLRLFLHHADIEVFEAGQKIKVLF